MDSLSSYLPASILSFLLENVDRQLPAPFRQDYETVVLFADVSGFTALCEAMAAKGPTGDEQLAKHLNSYFEVLNRTIGSQGGDVFKFAGDAILVVWPPSEEDLTTTTRRAAQCALEIKAKLQDVQLDNGLSLNVKVGVGVGPISILHIGGALRRMEYIATGQPLIQAFESEHCSLQREVILSPECWARVKDYFVADINESGHAFLKDCKVPVKKISVFVTEAKRKQQGGLSQAQTDLLARYVPAAILPFVEHHEERWAGELRRITVLFVNLGIGESQLASMNTEKDLNFIHKVLVSVQNALYKYEGSLNKFLMDDKGSTLISVYGLPPLAHEDDAVRGVLAALEVVNELQTLGLKGSVGVTFGMACAGLVGNKGGGRREYSILGDTVNLSARLMQYAGKNGGGVICDTATQYAVRHRIDFEDVGTITVKGKSKPLKVWKPVVQRTNLAPKSEEYHKYCHEPILVPTNEAFGANKRACLLRAINLLQKGGRSALPRAVVASKGTQANPTFALLDASASPATGGAGSKTLIDSIRQSNVLMAGKTDGPSAPGPLGLTAAPPARPKPKVVFHMQPKDSISVPAGSSGGSISAPPKPPPKTSISTTDSSSLISQRRGSSGPDLQSTTEQPASIEFSISVEPSQGEPASASEHSAPPRASHLRRNSNTFSHGAIVSPLLSSAVNVHNLQPVPSLKAIKVMLPDLLGHVTISAHNVFTIEQVKAETLFLCSKRNLIPDNTFQPADFYFCLDEIPDVHLPDNLPLCELDNYQESQKISAQKNYMNIITKPLKSINASPVLSLRMCKSSEEFRTDQMRRQREMLLESLQLFNQTGEAGTAIVVEGDAGLGKSRLVFSALQEVFGGRFANVSVGVYAALGEPYEAIPFIGYRDIFTQLMDEEIERQGRGVFSEPSADQNRQKLIAMKLATLSRANGERFIKYLALLNDLFDLQFVDTEESRKLSGAAKSAVQMEMLLALLKAWNSKSSPMLFVIDDALFLDSVSWQFAHRLMDSCENLLQVFITRPMNRSFLTAFTPDVDEHYLSLLKRDQVVHMVIHPRSDEVIYHIACETLGEKIDDMPTSLSDILLNKAQGNPLVVKELIANMKKDQLIEIDGLKVAISPSLAIYAQSLTNTSIRTPIPITLQGINGGKLDRLSHLQRMILKCGALIGETFTYALLEKVFPMHVDNDEKFRSELENLFNMNLIRAIDPTDGSNVTQFPSAAELAEANAAQSSGASDPALWAKDPRRLKFVFVSRMMRDMVLARMLDFQRKDLDTKIAESRVELARRKSEALLGVAPAGPPSPSPGPSQPFRSAGKPENVGLSGDRTSELVGKSLEESQGQPHQQPNGQQPKPIAGLQSGSVALSGPGSGSELSPISGSSRSLSVSQPLNLAQSQRSNSLGGSLIHPPQQPSGGSSIFSGFRRSSIAAPGQPETVANGGNNANARPSTIGAPFAGAASSGAPISPGASRLNPRLSVFPGVGSSPLPQPSPAAIAAAQQFQPAYESIIIIHERPLEYFLAALTQKTSEQKQREQQGEAGALTVPGAAPGARNTESLSIFALANARKSAARPAGDQDALLLAQAQQKPKFSRYYKEQQILAFWDSPQDAKTKNYMYPTLILDLEEAKIEPDQSNLHSFTVSSLVHYQVSRELPEGKFIQYAFEWKLTAIDEEQYEQWGRILFRRIAALEDPALALQIAIDDMSDNELDDEFDGEPLISDELRGMHSFNSHSSLSSNASTRNDSLSVSSTSGPSAVTSAISSLTPQERESFEKKFLTAVENEKALAVLPVQLMQIHKHEIESKSIFNKFHTDWKKRYVLLTEDLLSLRKKEKWILPVQAISLVIGQAEVELGGYDAKQKLHLFNVSADLWFKKGVTQYTRKTLLFGVPSAEEAKTWVEAIQSVIKLGASRFGRRFARHARASTWGQNNQLAAGSIIGGLGLPGGPRLSGSRRQSQVSLVPNQPPGTNQPPPPLNQLQNQSPTANRLFVSTTSGESPGPGLHQAPLTAPLLMDHSFTPPPPPDDSLPPNKPRSPSTVQENGYSIPKANASELNRQQSASYCDADTDESDGDGEAANSQRPGSTIQIQIDDSPARLPQPPQFSAAPNNAAQRVSVQMQQPQLPTVPSPHQVPLPGPPPASASPPPPPPIPQKPSSGPPPLSRMGSKVLAPSDGGLSRLNLVSLHQSAHQEEDSIGRAFDDMIDSINDLSAASSEKEIFRLTLLALKKRVGGHVRTLLSLLEKQEIHLSSLNNRKTISSLFAAEDLDESTKLWLTANFAPATQNVTAAPTTNNSPRHSQHFDFDGDPSDMEPVLIDEMRSGKEARLSPIPMSLAEYQSIPLGDILSWDWNLFDLTPNQRLPLLVQIFSQFDFFSRYNIRADVFVNFYRAIEENYLDVPFHSILHALDVCQTMFALLSQSQSQGQGQQSIFRFSNLEILCLLIAALSHDLRHPGTNNLFQINSRSPLAETYNDVSVLENYHCATLFRLLSASAPDCNVLGGLSAAEYKSARHLITGGILETDLARHAELMAKSSQLLDQMQAQRQYQQDGDGAEQQPQPPELSQSQRATMFNLWLHAADISNPAKQWAVAKLWSDAVFAELLAQGDKEKALGLPVSPNADRLSSNQDLLNINFIDFIVAPVFLAIRNVSPTMELAVQRIADNRRGWARIHESRLHSTMNNAEELAAEKARWARRTETFNQLIQPKDNGNQLAN